MAAPVTQAVEVIVTCTDRKTAPPPPRLRLRSVRARTVEERVRRWIDRLQEVQVDTVTARDLYAGDHWSVALDLPKVASESGIDARLWVCSAGYGLLPLQSRLKPYSATFASGHADAPTGSIGGPLARARSRAWWNELSRWSGPAPGNPRSLAELVRRRRHSRLLLVASPPYLNALAEDLEAVMKSDSANSRLLIVSAGADAEGPLREHVVPADSRLQKRLGGARQSLNARVAREVLRCGVLDSARLRQRFKNLLARQEELVPYERTPMTDEEVREFIRRELRLNPKAKHSPLLRKLREEGRACEQSRFRSRFQEVKEEMHAS